MDNGRRSTRLTTKYAEAAKRESEAFEARKAARAAKLQKSNVPKRRPAVTTNKKGRGLLDGMGDLPLDVTLEVFRYLGPTDLLNLARSTKSLRTILLNRGTSGTIWKGSFAHHDPPITIFPQDWSLVKLAHMLLDYECFVCGQLDPSKLRTMWEDGTRLCSQDECFHTLYKPAEGYTNMAFSSKDPVLKHLKQIVFMEYRYQTNQPQGMYAIPATFNAHRDALEGIKEDATAVAAYVKEQKYKKEQLSSLRYSLNKWEWDKRQWKKVDINKRRSERQEAYKKKLKELGYADVLSRLYISGLENLPKFKGVKPLTDREWKNIEPEVSDVMKILREDFAVQDRLRVLNTRIYQHLSPVRDYYAARQRSEMIPSLPELATLEPFRSLIFDSPLEQTVTTADFIPHLDLLGGITAQWREKNTHALLELVSNVTVPEGDSSTVASKKGKEKATATRPGVEILHLASTLFSCSLCAGILTYPTVLQHHCCTQEVRDSSTEVDSRSHTGEDESQSEDDSDDNGEPDEQEIPSSVASKPACRPWSAQCLDFDVEKSEVARAIIWTCGMDPNTTTLDEMDELDVRVECRRCCLPTGKYPRLAMTWRNAVYHELEKHAEEETSERFWSLLNEDDTNMTKAKEVNRTRNFYNSGLQPVFYRCAECAFPKIVGDTIVRPGWGIQQYRHEDPEKACSIGHDMSAGVIKQGGREKPATFKHRPFPVRI